MDEIWNIIHKTQEWGAYPSEHVIRFFARNYYNKNRSDIRVLDFGCGGGAHTWYLAREGFDTYAFDGAEYAVINAKKRLEKEGLNAHFSVFDGIAVKYENSFFDVVLDNACVYANRVEDIKLMYKSIFSFLKNGGKLLTICFGKNTSGYELGKEVEQGTFTDISDGPLSNRGITHFFTKNEIQDMLKEIGFKNIVVDSIEYTDRGYKIEQYVTQAEK